MSRRVRGGYQSTPQCARGHFQDAPVACWPSVVLGAGLRAVHIQRVSVLSPRGSGALSLLWKGHDQLMLHCSCMSLATCTCTVYGLTALVHRTWWCCSRDICHTGDEACGNRGELGPAEPLLHGHALRQCHQLATPACRLSRLPKHSVRAAVFAYGLGVPNITCFTLKRQLS